MAARKNPRADTIFKKFPNISTDELTVKDALAVRKALQKVENRIIQIGEVLYLRGERLEAIKEAHESSGTRRAIAVIDTWLRRDYKEERQPCTPHPSWKNLVWAVAYDVGGKNPAQAEKIAKNPKVFQEDTSENEFPGVSTARFEEEEDAPAMAAELQDVWAKWYEIGAGLKMPTRTLDLLKGTPDEQMTAMLKTWIREGPTSDPPSEPCWSHLVEVVAAPYGGEHRKLASDLAKEHPAEGGSAESEAQAMDTEPSSTTENDQANGSGAMSEDSATPRPAEPLSDEQPQIPLASIADDGGPAPTMEDFLMYRRNKYSGGKQAPHGLALVIANENFATLPRRICAPIDEYRLEKGLAEVGYRVVVKRNQTGRQMRQLFETIGKNKGKDSSLHVKKDDDSLICVISSHGTWDGSKNTDVIYGTDEKASIDLQEIVYELLGTTACERLKGKPKFFFVQACRGEQRGRIADDSRAVCLPRESDFLISYSTAPMTKAFRYDPGRPQPEGKTVDLSHEDENASGYKLGSFYITELCRALKKFSPRLDLMSTVLFVHQRLQASDEMLFHLSSGAVRQCPHMTVSLRGPFFFFDEAEKLFRDHMNKCLPDKK